MIFLREEKVFSLRKTAAAVPYGNITQIWEEFYAYLLVTGLFLEGEGRQGAYVQANRFSDNGFFIPSGIYNQGLADLLSKGLKDRFMVLEKHHETTSFEKQMLLAFNDVFVDDKEFFYHLSGKNILSIAYTRNFSPDFINIAHYVAFTFGQHDFPSPRQVPELYLSVFGNIHLSKEQKLNLSDPFLKYGSTDNKGNRITALWSLCSSVYKSFLKDPYPADTLSKFIEGFGFLTQSNNSEKSTSLPIYFNILYMKRLMGIESGISSVSYAVLSYYHFFYGSLEKINILRSDLFISILHLMMEKMGETQLSHLFGPNSYYQRVTYATNLTPHRITTTPVLLSLALEALDSDDNNEDQGSFDPDSFSDVSPKLNKKPTEDPSEDSSGYDPSAPGSTSPTNQVDDTIGLISFDKSGEGIDEAFYRDAVVALNDRLRTDNSLNITSEVKEALDYWVNGFLYRTAISATKELMAHLKLDKYLKSISTKG